LTLAEFRTRVRAYANDPSTSGTLGKTGVSELFTKELIDELGAESYMEATNLIRTNAPGFFTKTLVTATSSTEQHSWPSDFVRLIRNPVVSDDGTSLSSDESLGEEIGEIVPGLVHPRLVANGPKGWLAEQGGFRLIPKVTKSGSTSLILNYEFSPTFPSTGTASFTWPVNHTPLLCVMTARNIRETAGMDTGFLLNREGKLSLALLVDLHNASIQMPQFPSSAFRSTYTEVSVQGTQS